VEPHVPDGNAAAVAADLQRLVTGGVSAAAAALDLLADERDAVQGVSDCVDLVWSGPEAPGCLNRDTSVVVRELFATAKRSVLVASYVLDGGEKAQEIFEPLARRLDAGEHLDVKLFVNVARKYGDLRSAADHVQEFAFRFRAQVWPGKVLPVVYYDPRSLEIGGADRACLHAKCVVIDDEVAFVTSANFTEAAQLRNIEVGTLVRDVAFAKGLAGQFTALVRHGALAVLPLAVLAPNDKHDAR
jgi:phosphatidylserine/phosphatidylglycerophosphate/cardiolipin synthase-like enzyme